MQRLSETTTPAEPVGTALEEAAIHAIDTLYNDDGECIAEKIVSLMRIKHHIDECIADINAEART